MDVAFSGAELLLVKHQAAAVKYPRVFERLIDIIDRLLITIDFRETKSESPENEHTGVFDDADQDHSGVLQSNRSIDHTISIGRLTVLSPSIRSQRKLAYWAFGFPDDEYCGLLPYPFLDRYS